MEIIIDKEFNDFLIPKILNSYQRGVLALKLEPLLKGRHGRNRQAGNIPPLKGRARDLIGKKANISGGTLDKIKEIEKKATPEQKEKLISGERTIGSVYWEIINPFKQSKSGKYIYIIQAKNGGPIKIGIAIHPRMRLKDLQIGNPNELQIIKLIEGGIKEERELHRKFKKYQLTNEWFREEVLDLEPEIKPEFVREMGRIEKQKGIPFNDIDDLRRQTGE